MRLVNVTITIFFLTLALLNPVAIKATGSKQMSKQAAYQLLKSDQHQAVQALAKGEREVLLAVLALEKNHVDEAIQWLNLQDAQGNPLASLIKGEAYRRKSLAAALRAGNYAHAAQDDIVKLGRAELTFALEEAKKRLLAFMILDTQSSEAVRKDIPTPEVSSASIRTAIQTWLKDWQSLDHTAYMSHYHASFRTAKHDYASWFAYKKRVNQKKKYIHITISEFNIRRVQANTQQEAVIVSFKQQYQSSNYSSNSHKVLHLVRKHPQSPWLIMDEGDQRSVEKSNAKKIKAITPQGAQKDQSWVVNIASFHNLDNANAMRQKIQQEGFYRIFVSSVFVQGKRAHRVRIGPYPTQKEAQKTMHALCQKLEIVGCWLENGA
ncbi:MAG: SPOR domain-containing protein [Mariprofundaceae bacterium]|nr:SPOR domain-containing protein [Mariprofundaceae bacterium]